MSININSLRLLKLSMFFVLLVTLMCSGFGAVLATNAADISDDSQGSGMSLEEFCHLYALYKSHGDTTEYERIYSQLTSTEVTLEIRPATANPANDTVSQTIELSGRISASTQTTRGAYYLTSAIASPPMYDVNGKLIGEVTNVGNIVGSPDGNYAKLVTTGWSGDPYNAYAGEALTNGYLGRVSSGAITVHGMYNNQYKWDNYVIIQYYYNGVWTYLAATKVTNTSPMDYAYGPIYASYTQVSVSCCTMPPPYPAGTSMLLNSILFDAVSAYN